MEGEEERSESTGSFSKASIPKRIAIVAAGAIVNIVFGLVVYFILMSTTSTYITNKVDSIIDGYVAQEIGLKQNDEIIESRQAKKYSLIAFGIIVLLIAYAIIPGLPWSGWLLNTSEEQYIAQLFGYDSPFRNAFVFIIALIFIVCGYIYGKASKNIKDNNP